MKSTTTPITRRVLAGLLTTFALLGAACGSDSDDEQASTKTSSTAEASTAAEGAEASTAAEGAKASTAAEEVDAEPVTGAKLAEAMADGCPTEMFPDLSSYAGPGGDYAKPEVAASCSDGELVVKSNDMPTYTYTAKTPNPLEVQDFEWKVPLEPTVADSVTTIVNRLGTLGFTLTGIPVYGPTEGPIPPDQPFGDPVYNSLLDTCGGHTGGDADYHLHTVIYSEAMCNLQSVDLLGFAIDGFPIYNSVVCLDEKCDKTDIAQSGYTVTGDPSAQVWNAVKYTGGDGAGTAASRMLDECNGRVEPDGSYAYHVTVTQFPYIIGCFKGTPTEQSGAAAADMPAMNAGAAPANG